MVEYKKRKNGEVVAIYNGGIVGLFSRRGGLLQCNFAWIFSPQGKKLKIEECDSWTLKRWKGEVEWFITNRLGRG